MKLHSCWLALTWALVSCASRAAPSRAPEPVAAPAPAQSTPEPVSATSYVAPDWLPADTAAGVESPALRELLEAHWAWGLEQSPVWATELGVHEFDSRLGDWSRKHELEERQKVREFLNQAKQIEAASLNPMDTTTLQIFVFGLEQSIAGEVCEFSLWSIDPRWNVITILNHVPKSHPLKTEQDADNLLARYQQMPAAVAQVIENLRVGASQGYVANKRTTENLLQLTERQLAEPLAQWSLMEPAQKVPESWPDDLKTRFKETLTQRVKAVEAAYRSFQSFVTAEILPKARGADAEGIAHIPNGEQCYRAMISAHTTIPTDADTAHEIGQRELKRIHAEMEQLGKRALKKTKLAAILEQLRSNKALYFQSAEEIVKTAEQALAKATEAAPKYFKTMPRADCVVQPIPDYAAPEATMAYYRAPHPDGSKPGEYFVNTHEPQRFPKHEAEVLAFHESVPGHHFQIALAQELTTIPAFRKHGGFSAFTEGWGLYAEQLAEEMGLYSTDLDRLGRLGFEAWRAARLVVDTGLHAKGWTRKQAIDFMMANTALSQSSIETEVDRYIAWPGQALAYKTGQLEILRLRDKARRVLGRDFDIKEFHDVVLSKGAVPLRVLEAQVEQWLVSDHTATSKPDEAATH